jgi:benzylsuccinate CoA-transferase BbsF subunit
VRREWLGSRRRHLDSETAFAAEPAAALPLDALKVADLSWVVAGPVIGRTLADFGATVVRVESASKIETARHMAPFYGGEAGIENSALYMNCNAGKLGLALDLSKDESREVVRDLARWADVLVESYTPGLMERWGLGYEQLSTLNPKLIMLSSSLMGNTGRYSRLAGYGNIGAAMSGFQYIVGWPDRDPIGPFGPYTDFVAPRFSLAALLAALEDRRSSGRGCYIDVSQVECGTWFLSPEIAAFGLAGTVQERRGNRDSFAVPHGVFPCRAVDGGAEYVAIVIRNDEEFRGLTRLMGAPDLCLDPRFESVEDRRRNQDELEEMVATWTAALTASQIESLCVAERVPAHRASRSPDFVDDEQLAFRGHLVRVPHSLHGEVTVEGPRYLLSETPGVISRGSPMIGENSDFVLSELLEYSPKKIEELKRNGAIT